MVLSSGFNPVAQTTFLKMVSYTGPGSETLVKCFFSASCGSCQCHWYTLFCLGREFLSKVLFCLRVLGLVVGDACCRDFHLDDFFVGDFVGVRVLVGDFVCVRVLGVRVLRLCLVLALSPVRVLRLCLVRFFF